MSWSLQKKVIVAVVLAAALAVSGVAVYASPQEATGQIQACVKNNGDIRIVLGNNAACSQNEQLLSWNVSGPKGDKGDQGITGAQGPAGPMGPAGPAGTSPDLSALLAANEAQTAQIADLQNQLQVLTAKVNALNEQVNPVPPVQMIPLSSPVSFDAEHRVNAYSAEFEIRNWTGTDSDLLNALNSRTHPQGPPINEWLLGRRGNYIAGTYFFEVTGPGRFRSTLYGPFAFSGEADFISNADVLFVGIPTATEGLYVNMPIY